MSNTYESVQLVQRQDYQFEMQFGGDAPPWLADEPPPLGQGAGPSPVQLLAASVGNCLSDSLLFALRKFKQAPDPIRCEVRAEVGRNTEGRLRVLAQFESFCTVTQSVGAGIPVTVQVFDAAGVQLK